VCFTLAIHTPNNSLSCLQIICTGVCGAQLYSFIPKCRNIKVPHLMNQKPAITTCLVPWQTCKTVWSRASSNCITNIEIQLQTSCRLKITTSERGAWLLFEDLPRKPPDQDHADAVSEHASKCNCNRSCRSHAQSNYKSFDSQFFVDAAASMLLQRFSLSGTCRPKHQPRECDLSKLFGCASGCFQSHHALSLQS
jgi:hypothetical protein